MRSLRMKLVLIMVLLVVALMTVVGSFLINGVGNFYIDQFYNQMNQTFSTDFIAEMSETAQEGPQRLKEFLMSQSNLGIDLNNRNVFILDGAGRYLDGSAGQSELGLEITANILTAMGGDVGQTGSIIASYMDVAIPVTAGDATYIVYIRDNKKTVDSISSQVLVIILQALALGLVICIVLSFLLAEIMITPIEALTKGAGLIAAGDFSKLPVPSKDEIGVLTETFNDMSQTLKDTLEEVENERNKLSTLFLRMTDGVVAFNQAGEMIHANPAAAGMLHTDLTNPASYQQLFGDTVAFADLFSLKSSEYIAAEKKVGASDLELVFAPFYGGQAQSGVGGVLVVIHDMTEQRKAEEIRREFVANVSHELRTPLTNIKSYAETLVDSGDGLPKEMKDNFFGVILSETDRMTRIVQDLLTLSRFDYGRMEMNNSRFSIEKSVQEVFNAVILDAKNHSHDLTLEMEENLPEIYGDKERIAQVIMNILSNAIKYTPDGGHIELSAKNGAEKTVEIAVKDNGIGIPEKDLPRLFDRFYRVDKARSRESGGTGLGLAIAKEIVREHGGDIIVESALGKGTRVTVILKV